jgi:predicted dienelactone hydrolase
LFLALLIPLLATCAHPAMGSEPATPLAPAAPPPTPPAVQAPPADPALPGPYPVGITTRTFQRRSVTDGALATIDVTIWYPAAPVARTLPVNAHLRGVPGVAPADGPFPVLVFSHAAASSPIQSTFLTAHLASHGFVVAAPTHPGSTFDDCLGCGSQARMESLLRDSAANRPSEVSMTLDLLESMNTDPRSPFAGTLDTTRAGVLGHSWGGYTAIIIGATDPRFRAALAMAPVADATVTRYVGQLEEPVMVMTSALDDITPFPPQAHLFAGIPAATPRFLIDFPRGGHTAYSEVCPAGTPGCRPGELGETRAHELVNGYATAFLERYVAGDTRYTALLTAAMGGNDVLFIAPGLTP